MVLPLVTYLITRRTWQRFFRFPPGDPVVKQIFEYSLAYAASLTGVQVHAWILMSNHFHIVATDVRGVSPQFFQLLDQTIVNLLKRHFPDIEGSVWNTSQPSAVDLSNELSASEVTLIEKLVYTMGNAKTSGLVAKWTQWEGSMSKPEDMGQRVLRVSRPECASTRTKLPAKVETQVHVPAGLKHWKRQELMEMLRGELKRIPRPVNPIGMKRIREQSIWDRPKTKAKKSTTNPRFAGDVDRRKAMVALLRAFRADYLCALQKHCAGEACVFPEGTWKMRVLFGVKVVGSDPPATRAA